MMQIDPANEQPVTARDEPLEAELRERPNGQAAAGPLDGTRIRAARQRPDPRTVW
jgi:hypothetical protein